MYKQEIADARFLDSKKDHVHLIEQSDLRKLQMEKQPGTPEGNMSILAAFRQKSKKRKNLRSWWGKSGRWRATGGGRGRGCTYLYLHQLEILYDMISWYDSTLLPFLCMIFYCSIYGMILGIVGYHTILRVRLLCSSEVALCPLLP